MSPFLWISTSSSCACSTKRPRLREKEDSRETVHRQKASPRQPRAASVDASRRISTLRALDASRDREQRTAISSFARTETARAREGIAGGTLGRSPGGAMRKRRARCRRGVHVSGAGLPTRRPRSARGGGSGRGGTTGCNPTSRISGPRCVGSLDHNPEKPESAVIGHPTGAKSAGKRRASGTASNLESLGPQETGTTAVRPRPCSLNARRLHPPGGVRCRA